MSTKKSYYVPATFKDAGTEKEYEGGKSHDFTEGEYQNFKAAGLIGDKPEAAKAKSGDKSDATDPKTGDKPSTGGTTA